LYPARSQGAIALLVGNTAFGASGRADQRRSSNDLLVQIEEDVAVLAKRPEQLEHLEAMICLAENEDGLAFPEDRDRS
jgi:hypothetical protein